MFTMEELINNKANINEIELVKISDKLWEIGNLEEIKEQVSPNLFYLHIAINIIGNWKTEGWWGIICEQAGLVPYIPEALNKLGLPELKVAFESVITIFPEYTIFDPNNSTYCDIVNFFQNIRFKVQDKRLSCIAQAKRKEMVNQVQRNLDKLESLTEPFFSENSERNGWKQVLDYINKNIINNNERHKYARARQNTKLDEI